MTSTACLVGESLSLVGISKTSQSSLRSEEMHGPGSESDGLSRRGPLPSHGIRAPASCFASGDPQSRAEDRMKGLILISLQSKGVLKSF